MARCRYKIWRLDKKWYCPLGALTGEECCYWHREEDSKKPTEEQLKELEVNEIVGVYLQKAELYRANLSKANLSEANLQEASLYGTNLRGAELYLANLQEADLEGANLQEVNLSRANLQGANFYGAKFTSETDLGASVLIGATLFHSYFDETKSFRNAKVFQNGGGREINEIVGDCIDGWFIWILDRMPRYMVNMVTKVLKNKPNRYLHIKPYVLDVRKIEKTASSVAKKLGPV